MSPLKYLFVATFEDGSTIEQTPDDKSAIDPEKRSQFFDVLRYGETSPIVRFELFENVGEFSSKPPMRYAVDLRDGHFELCDVPFQMHEEPVSDLRLIFFRNHKHTFNQFHEERSHEVVYRTGWQTTKDGEIYQRVMQIS
jgi:hypothetical protein